MIVGAGPPTNLVYPTGRCRIHRISIAASKRDTIFYSCMWTRGGGAKTWRSRVRARYAHGESLFGTSKRY